MENAWLLKRPPEVLVENIDGLLACFCASTGQTHILDAFPAEILQALADEPKTLEEINRYLAAILGEHGQWQGKTESILADLSSLQLVERRPV